jgi:enoyl-CoA hydratase
LITLCAVDNTVAAAGFQLALTCDLIVATKKATFGIAGMKRGLFPSTPLVQLERSSKSGCLNRQIVLFGDSMSAE